MTRPRPRLALALLGASFLAVTLCLVSLSPRAAAAQGLDDLQALLQEAIDAYGLDVTIAVTDLQTGESAAVRGEEPRLTGCTINLLVLVQAVLDMEAGLLLEEQVDWTLRQTIYWSEPHQARELVYLIGAGDVRAGIRRLRELAARLELATAVYDHPPAYDIDSVSLPVEAQLAGEPLPAEDASMDGVQPVVEGEPMILVPDNVISPLDMNRVLGALWRGEILSPDWTMYLLDRLTRVSPGLQYLLGTSGGGRATVHHKNGYYWTPQGYTDNDVGIVSFSAGGQIHAYAVSYYADHLEDEFADIVIGQRLMRLVWDYFQARYAAP